MTGGYFYLRRQHPINNPRDAKNAVVDAVTPAKPAFTGGDQGFISLVLDKTEIVNHNTKRLTFKLPEPDMESGLPVASAVITKYKGPEMEKPVIRPYTPVSDVGEWRWSMIYAENWG
jgi:cytochrome-b5 reductase